LNGTVKISQGSVIDLRTAAQTAGQRWVAPKIINEMLGSRLFVS